MPNNGLQQTADRSPRLLRPNVGSKKMKWIIIVGIIGLIFVGFGLARYLSRQNGVEVTDDWPPEVKAKIKASQALRAKVQAEYPKLFIEIRQCLFQNDPVGINFETNTDEYDPEVGTIIPRLQECASQNDVLNVVHEEFTKWFGADVAGPKTNYTDVSENIWNIWKTRETQPGH